MAEFDESLHPRDSDGKFSGGALGTWAKKRMAFKGGGAPPPTGSLKGWATAKGKEGSLAAATAPGKRMWANWAPKGMDESWKGHYDKNPEEGGKVDAQRDKDVHQPIIHGVVDHVEAPAPGAEKVAVFTMGGPGSGKGGIIRDLNPNQYAHIDPDEIRSQLPEYKKATGQGLTFKGAAEMTHPEASDIARKMTAEAIKQGKNVIIDGTGSNIDSISKKMENLRKAGYKIHLAFAHLPEEEGVKRIAERAERSGRDVPEDFVRSSYKKIPANFTRIAKHADTWAVHDTSQKGSPVVWSKGADGKENEADEDFVQGFKSAYGRRMDWGRTEGLRKEALI